MRIRLGQVLRDRITGFEGTAVARIEYLNGCVRYHLQPGGVTADGKMREAEWVDEQQLMEGSAAPAGGPGDTPPPMATPRLATP